MPRSLSNAANYVLEEFKSFGIQVPDNSRLICMYKAVCNSNGRSRGFIPENDPNFMIAREALRDITQLEFFFDQVKDDPNRANYKSVVQRITSDSPLPQNDKSHTSGRDAQAELFVFAVCKNGGLSPIFEEPDITCQLNGKRFGVAVKRIKNLKQFGKRVNEATKQLQKRTIPSVISVELTMAMNPENYSIVANMPDVDLRSWWVQRLQETVDPYHSKLCNTVQNKGVRGVFLHEHYPVRFNKNYTLRSMNYGIKTAKGLEEEKEWSNFKNTFVKGLPNLTG